VNPAELSETDRAAIKAGRYRVRRPGLRGEITTSPDGATHWTCHVCHERFDQWEPAQRHSNDSGHHRLALEIPVTR
jgi:hypothetical protein